MTPRLPLPARPRAHFLLFLFPVLLAGGLQATLLDPRREEQQVEVGLERVRAARAAELEADFAAAQYAWPPAAPVPRLALRRLPRDLDTLPVEQKKALFFRLVLPLVLAENQRLQNQRELLQRLFATPLPPDSHEYRQAQRIAHVYRVSGDINAQQTRALLLQRVDVIPPALALAQAADESAWGTSRFARQGNSLFGQWTWVRGEGLVPLRRAAGKGHLVRSFPELRAGVRAYFHNLNVGHAYGRFRYLRARLRSADKPLDAELLATGLTRYSERGAVYVEEIRGLMRDNGLLAWSQTATLQPL